MTRTLLTTLFSSIFALSLCATNDHTHVIVEEALDVAELIIRLARDITNDISPPATGAERTVTQATVTNQGGLRVYRIEGKDVYHTGRVLSTYRITLQKSVSVSDGLLDKDLDVETYGIIEALLNGLQDIAEMNLTHSKVKLNYATLLNTPEDENRLVYEFEGVNEVCEHTELNTFKITVTREVERSRPRYTTELQLPYAPEYDLQPHCGTESSSTSL